MKAHGQIVTVPSKFETVIHQKHYQYLVFRLYFWLLLFYWTAHLFLFALFAVVFETLYLLLSDVFSPSTLTQQNFYQAELEYF